jgi:hypothetical protein
VIRVAYVLVALLGVFALCVGYLWAHQGDLLFAGGVGDTQEAPRLDGVVAGPWDTVRIATADSVHILLLEVRQKTPTSVPWVIFFYGAAQHLADESSRARYDILRSLGVNVLAVEYRGYGASEQVEPSEEGLYEDGRAAWLYLTKTRSVPASRIALYGSSLGTGVAVELATEVHPGGLITQGTYTSLPAAAGVRYPWIPGFVIRRLMRSQFNNLKKAGQVSSPWLLLHGSHDGQVPLSQAEALSHIAGGPRRLVTVNSGHLDMPEVARDAMTEAMGGFFKELGWRGSP